MSTAISFNGVSYSVPSALETDWADLSEYLIALSTGTFQRSGGSFVLTADADFGANFGLKSTYYKSRSANLAAAGIVRFANAEGISWRNAANSADLALLASASDRLTFGGVDVPTISSTDAFTNKSISGSTNTITNVPISTGISGLGTSVATFLGTPSSANLLAAVTDETGTGALVFGTNPTFTTALNYTTTTTLIKADTSDASDTKRIQICGGGSNASTRGAYIILAGNEFGSSQGGSAQYIAGDSADAAAANAAHIFYGSLITGAGGTVVFRVNGNGTAYFLDNNAASTSPTTGLALRWNTSASAGGGTKLSWQNSSGVETCYVRSKVESGTALSLAFGTFNSSVAETMVLSGAGVLSVGPPASTATNLVVTGAASANAIVFPATQVSSAGANTLDDYEEGTFTPSLAYDTPGTSSFTYAANGQVGRYTKIGNVVTLYIYIGLTAFSKGTASGNLRVAGAPFSVVSATNVNSPGIITLQNWTYSNRACCYIGPSSATITLATESSGGVSTGIGDPSATSNFWLQLTYFTAT